MARVIIVLGPPGSGKGTQCKGLAGILNIPHVSTGDLLRDHVRSKTAIGQEANHSMSVGKLVPDAIVAEVLRRRISEQDCLGGFLLDGFPRSEEQVHLLDECLNEVFPKQDNRKWIFRLVLPESVILQRIAGRLTCPICARTFVGVPGAKVSMERCDADGSSLVTRHDDKEELVRDRVRVFERTISAIVARYIGKDSVIEIKADLAVERVTDAILHNLCDHAGHARAKLAPARMGVDCSS